MYSIFKTLKRTVVKLIYDAKSLYFQKFQQSISSKD